MAKREAIRFDEFAARFVREYWQDVADNAGKLPPYEPCSESVDELLAAVKYSTSHESAANRSGNAYVLRMVADSGSIWRFAFADGSGKWVLLEAFANDETDEYRVNMLDEFYGKYFRPSLERSVALATH